MYVCVCLIRLLQARPSPEDTDTNEGARTKGEGEGDRKGEAGQRGGEGDTEDQQPPDSTKNVR